MESERLDLLSRITSNVDARLSALFGVWEQTGFTSEDRFERMEVVAHQVDKTLAEMVAEEKRNFQTLLKVIEGREREHASLCKELSLNVDEESRASKLALLTILELDKELRQEVQRLRGLKDERMKEVLELKAEDEELCHSVGIEPVFVSSKVVPSNEKLEEVKKHINDTKALKRQRLGKFCELKSEIINLYTQLECEPNSTFERKVICDDESSIVLSFENLNAAENILSELQQKFEATMKYADEMRERISQLMDKLEVSGKEAFLLENTGFTRAVIQELESKLAELEKMKLQHIEEFITKVRDELVHWWGKCYYGAAQQAQFSPFHSTDYTEKLLEMHEAELDRVKQYYHNNSPLFAMVSECQDLWATRLELERRSKDPSRLGNYKILAQEEKDRKRVNTRLPKVEQLLFDAIQKFEDENGTPFLVGGVPFKDYWEGQVEQHNLELLMEKQQKSTLKKQMNIHETIYGSTPARNNPSSKPSKRRLPDPTPDKRSKLAKIERSATLSHLGPARQNLNLQRTSTTSNLLKPRSATLQQASKSRLQRSRPGRVLRSKNDTIITGSDRPNIMIDSVSSNVCQTGFHHEAVSSTFRFEPENLHTPIQAKPFKSSTPATAPTMSKHFVFKTPSSRALTPVNKNKALTLRSGKKLPFLI